MNLPPMILDLRINPAEKRPVHLWLPIFLLWPLAVALGILSLVLTILADLVLLLLGQHYHRYTILLLRSFEALTETRGMVVRIKDQNATVDMTIQ